MPLKSLIYREREREREREDQSLSSSSMNGLVWFYGISTVVDY